MRINHTLGKKRLFFYGKKRRKITLKSWDYTRQKIHFN